MCKRFLVPLTACLASAILVVQPAPAQDQQTQDRQQRERQRQEQARQQQQRDRQARQQGRSWQLDPQGWVMVATDYDRDGRYDAWETVHYYDLQMAKRRSQQRRAQGGQARDREARDQGRAPDQMGDRSRRAHVRLSGKLVDRRTVDLVGDDAGDVVIGKIERDGGEQVSAYLGAKNRLQEIDLQTGDQVRIEGVRARINNRPFIISQRVSTNGQSITNRLPWREPLRQFTGEIRDLRTERFKNREGDYLVAKLRSRRGQQVTINLGRKDELRKLDLQEGDRVNVLARQGRIGGERALIAQLVRANDRTADVRGETRRHGGESRQMR